MGVADDLELTDADAPMLDTSRARHGEAHRRYHDWSHVEALARDFAEHRNLFVNGRAAALAVLYHDAVYACRPGEDEAESAALLLREREGAEEGAALRLAEAMICATAGHAAPPALSGTDAADCAAFLDLDLGILAATPDAYDRYAEAVRAEYAHAPAEMWRAGRAQVLSGFLACEQIYLTDALHEAWDEAARENVARELGALRAGLRS